MEFSIKKIFTSDFKINDLRNIFKNNYSHILIFLKNYSRIFTYF